jgi:hypothetical protein
LLNIENAQKIPGWMTDQELNFLAEEASKRRCIVEVGSWRGRSLRAMADNTSGVIFSVDPWSDDSLGFPGWWNEDGPKRIESPEKYKEKDWLWNEMRKNLGEHIGRNVIPVRKFSADAIHIFERWMIRFDMIFIDASHDFAHVEGDILMWRPLLKPGGLFCGHDYGEPTCPDVKRAVDKYVELEKVVGTIWVAK